MAKTLEDGVAFAQQVRAGANMPFGWSSLPAPMNAGALARGGFKAVCVDMQHSFHDEASTFASIQAVHQAGSVAGLRIPVGRFDLASRALDASAQFVIAPMINTVADAQAFVAAMKYPPIGGRSWGPAMALDLFGAAPADYLACANDMVLAIAMIETVEAQENLDAILAVPGIDGVFVGPSDLSITLAQGARIEATAPHVLEAAGNIGTRARQAGKVAGVYAFDAEKAQAFFDRGFTFAAVGSDALSLKASAAVGSSIG
ncbi:MAG: HpcH/HpaI aldolase/citrate lyase family protein [Devosiaceae bacterium]